jgi:hypothetical protein
MAQIRWSVHWAACESGLLATGWGGHGQTTIRYKHSNGRGAGIDIALM